MRVLGFLVWAVIVAALLLPLLRGGGRRRRRPEGDELVKDPVCQAYVVRSRPIVEEAGGAPVYFCSPACARRYAAALGG
jgi:YHS domain-containing protein